MEDYKIKLLKEEIKKYIRKYLEEMSTTGAGAAPGTGASFSPGSGENYATSKAFVGGSAKNKKKEKIFGIEEIDMVNKKYLLTEALKEEVGYTPEKANQILDTIEKNLGDIKERATRIFNATEGATIGEIIEVPGKINKLNSLISNLDKKLSDYQKLAEAVKDQFEDSDKRLYDRADQLDAKCWSFGKYVDAIGGVCDKLSDFVRHTEEYAEVIKRHKEHGKTN